MYNVHMYMMYICATCVYIYTLYICAVHVNIGTLYNVFYIKTFFLHLNILQIILMQTRLKVELTLYCNFIFKYHLLLHICTAKTIL